MSQAGAEAKDECMLSEDHNDRNWDHSYILTTLRSRAFTLLYLRISLENILPKPLVRFRPKLQGTKAVLKLFTTV